jgi:hypothetical protein
MASERQIAANRRNAANSTGPRSSAGKSRASRNAYRHGLSVSVGASAPLASELEKRARQIAGNTDDTFTLELAREIAQAELDLARVRRAKVAIIERAQALAAADRPQVSVSQVNVSPRATVAQGDATTAQPDRSAEAIRRVLPDLRKLDRYERGAAARRDRAAFALDGRIKF